MGAQLGDLRGRALDRVGDVVQLQVDEHPLARLRELRRQAQAAAVGELHANLIKSHAVAEFGDETLGLGRVGRVERDDQPIQGVDYLRAPGPGGMGSAVVHSADARSRRISRSAPRRMRASTGSATTASGSAR